MEMSKTQTLTEISQECLDAEGNKIIRGFYYGCPKNNVVFLKKKVGDYWAGESSNGYIWRRKGKEEDMENFPRTETGVLSYMIANMFSNHVNKREYNKEDTKNLYPIKNIKQVIQSFREEKRDLELAIEWCEKVK